MISELILAAAVAAFVLLPASLVAYYRATHRPKPVHDPAQCLHCAAMRHPSQAATRDALAYLLPRQVERKIGGAE